ncbi:MAG: RNA methyltransferase [Clostridia bacterium]|nr:RNA methyltransferase [Clostridia bacterium]
MHNREILTSPDNKKIKELQQLGKKKYRREQNAFVIEGIRFVESALEKSIALKDVFYSSALWDNERGTALIEAVEAKGYRLHEVAPKLFDAISDTVNSQGVLAVAPMMPEVLDTDILEGETTYLSLVLDRIQDPGNLGTMIRTADAAGIKDIFLVKGTTDPYSTKVLRSTMGSIFDVRLHMLDTDEVIAYAEQHGIRLVVTSLDASLYHYELAVQDKLAIVIGNEGNGVSKEFLEAADDLIKIPIYGGAESLNASVAAGIVLYDFAIRQKKLMKMDFSIR